MFEAAFTAIVNKASPWVINILLLAFAGVIIIWVVSTIGVLRKNIYAQNITEKYIDLQNAYNETNNNSIILHEKFRQSRTILEGLKGSYSELKYMLYLFSQGEDIQEQAMILLKSITDRITADIKFYAGEVHRCAIWTPNNEEKLEMLVASAGFPDYYRTQRSLNLDASVAGRCFRTRTSLYIPDVNQDRDFRHTPGSVHKYHSLICVPLIFGEICLGIITVDGKKEDAFTCEAVETVEAYGEIATMVRMMQITSYYQYSGGSINGESL